MAKAELGISIPVDDAGLAKFIESLTRIVELAGGILPSAFEKGAKRIADNEKSLTATVVDESEKRKKKKNENALSEAEVEDRANKASAESAKRYATLKAEYEGRSLDDVRAKIMQFEEQTRTLRRARSEEDDVQIKKELQNRINSVNTELQLYRSLEKDKTGRTFSEQMERLHLSEKTDKEIRNLQKQQKEQFESLQRQMTVTQNTEEQKRLHEQIANLKAEQAAVKAESEERAKGFGQIKSQLTNVEGGLKSITANFAQMGGAGTSAISGILPMLSSLGPVGMTAAAGVAVLTVGIGSSIAVGMKFQDSMADLSAITGAEGKTLEGLGDKARELGVKFGTGASSGVEAFKLVVSALGPEVAKDKDAMAEMGDDVMTLAKVAGVDAPQATAVLTNTLNQFGGATLSAGEKAKEMTHIMNVMAAGAKEGAAEVPDLSEAIKIVGTVAHGSKMSIEETTAAIETMSMSGLKGGEAGTGLRNVILDLSSGTKKSKAALSELGLTFDQVNPEKVGFTNSLRTMKEQLGKVSDATQRAEIMSHLFGKENIASANILISGVEQVNEMTKAVTGTNEAHEQAAKKMATFSESMARVGAKIEDVGIGIFNAIEPVLSWMGNALGDLIPILIKAAEYGFWPIKIVFEAIFYVGERVGLLLGKLGGWIGGLIGKLADWFTHLKFVQQALAWVKQGISDVIEWVMSAYKTISNFIDKVGSIIDKVTGKKHEVTVEITPVIKAKDAPIITPNNIALGESEDEKKADKSAAKAAKAEAKSKEEIAKAHADEMLAIEKDKNALLTQTKKQRALTEANIEIEHAKTLLDIAKKFHGESSAQYIHANATLTGLREKARDAEGAELKSELKAMNDKWKESYAEQEKIEKQKEKTDTEILKQEQDNRIAVMDDGFAKERAAEDLKYKRELEALRIQLEQKELTQEQYNKKVQLAKEADLHAQLAIDKKESTDRLAKNKELTSGIAALAMAGGNDRLKLASEFASKNLGLQNASMLMEKDGWKKFLISQGADYASSYIARLVTTVTGEASMTGAVAAGQTAKTATVAVGQAAQTGAVSTGVLARVALYAWESIQSIASTAATWVATAAKAVYSAFVAAPFPVNLLLAGAAVAGVYELSTAVAGMFKPKKMAEGGVSTESTIVNTSEFGQHEAIVPLNKYPGMADMMDGGISAGIQQLNVTMQNVHNAVNSIPTTAVLPPYSSKIWQGQATRIVNQRKVGA